jgi:hypothetical protein
MAAGRRGLKPIRDRDSARTGMKRYFLRPTCDARKTLLPLPDGGWTLANIEEGRRIVDSLMSLDKIENLLGLWHERRAVTPARVARRGENRPHA